jgi:PPOX class probable F420-dependent enzyme
MRELVLAASVGRLATVSAGGRPHIVPLCYALTGDTIYSAVDQKPKQTKALRRIANLRATGHASLLVDHYEDDWDRLWWVRCDGTGRVVVDETEAVSALRQLAGKYAQYARIAPSGPVLAVDVATWRAWSASR